MTPNKSATNNIAFVDVHYQDTVASAACLIAQNWTAPVSIEEQIVSLYEVKPYVPGAFFERELPCVLKVLSQVKSLFSIVVIDGYVYLDQNQRPGLGGHLYDHFGGDLVVIGVAKTAFQSSDFAVKVTRGSSANPLYITSQGIDPLEASELVKNMHGAHRIPTLIGRVDRLARTYAPLKRQY